MNNKLCNSCGYTKDVSEFNKKGAILQSKCRECSKAYAKEHYQKNKGTYYTNRNKRREVEFKEWWRSYKSTLSCNRCSESHVACLHFHHLDPNNKEANLSVVARGHWGKERILKEVEKCEVLCANCHAKEHFIK